MADRPVVVAPAPFKGAVGAADAARAIAAGLRLAGHGTLELPVADGGEGTRDALVAAAGGITRTFTVSDPLGRPVDADVGLLPGGTVVVELAAASGYERLAPAERDPERTSTFGTGELLRLALDLDPTRIVLAVGGSATNDGGLGIMRALGARLLDREGNDCDGRGGDLSRVVRIDRARLDPRLAQVPIDVACDVRSPFCGPNGAARVFGSQKGADAAAVDRLDAGLAALAAVLEHETGIDVRRLDGAGAAGGVGGGVAAVLGARLVTGATLVLDAIGLREELAGSPLCVTGEGRLDEQSLTGKAPVAVAELCRELGVPCVAVCGEVDLLPGLVRRAGFAAAFPIRRTVDSTLADTTTELTAMGAALGGLLSGVSPPPTG